MGKFKEMVHKLPEDREVMEHLTDMLDELMESIKISHPQKYNSFMDKLKDMVHSGHFSKESYEEIMNHLDNHFSVEDTTRYAKEIYELDFDKENFTEYDFNFIINEMYRMFHPIYQEEMDKYTELTLAWLDYNKGKALWYYNKLYK